MNLSTSNHYGMSLNHVNRPCREIQQTRHLDNHDYGQVPSPLSPTPKGPQTPQYGRLSERTG